MFSRLTPVVKNLLIINVAVFVIFNMLLNVDVGDLLGLRLFTSSEFQPYQLVTHIFAHANGGHLFGNMFSLFIFGPMLEHFMGPKKFLTFFLVCGFGASALFSTVNYFEVKKIENAYESYAANPDPDSFTLFVSDQSKQYLAKIYEFVDAYKDSPNNEKYIDESKAIAKMLYNYKLNVPMIGASGAVFGILMAFALLFPNTELMLLFIPFPIKAKYLVGAYILYEIYALIQRAEGDNVAHFAHLGGALFAYILIRYWRKNSVDFY